MILLEYFSNKKIAVIGTGYIGSNLIQYFKSSSAKFNISVLEFNKSNIAEIKFHVFDYVFNCAGNSGDFRSDILGTIDSNIGLTLFLLKNIQVKEKYVCLSSTRIYGFSPYKNILFDESMNGSFNNQKIDYIYDGTKKLVESILLNYSSFVDFNVNIVRLSNVYGKFNKLDDATLIKKILRLKKENKNLPLGQNICDSTKDYIYIDDSIVGILKTALYGKNNEIYNIASGKSYSVREISKLIELELEVFVDNVPAKFSNIDISKTKRDIDFYPKIEMLIGLKKSIE